MSISKQPQIIAVGGKLLIPREKPLLERYILDACGAARPNVCFIPTATGDDPAYIERFYQTYAALAAHASHLSLFTRTPRNLREFLLAHDVIHVGGGNTRSMLAVWRHWGIDVILREAWESGIVLTGSSAGMLCWFSAGVTDSVEGNLTITDGLSFIPVSACPHFNGEAERRPAYHAMVATGELPAGYAADDAVGIHFIGTELHTVISSEAKSTAYLIEKRDDKVVETALPTTLLG